MECICQHCKKTFVPENGNHKKYCSSKCQGNGYYHLTKEKRKAKIWANNLKWMYGLTKGEYDQKLANQKGACDLCKKPLGDGPICVDHDHRCCPGIRTCGKCVRGLIHKKCNSGLGHFEDDPDTCLLAARYILRYGKIERNLQESMGG